MPSCKSDITLIVKIRGKGFSINGVLLPDNKVHIKNGRSWSDKTPTATLTEIFDLSRKFAVKQMKGNT